MRLDIRHGLIEGIDELVDLLAVDDERRHLMCGDGNATMRLAEPVTYGPMWGGTGKAVDRLAVNFVSEAAMEARVKDQIKSNRQPCRLLHR